MIHLHQFSRSRLAASWGLVARAKAEEGARFDGVFVLRTNTDLAPRYVPRSNTTLNALAVMLRYRELLRLEEISKTTKSILDTRPIYHTTDATVRGHVFCSFPALVVRKAWKIASPRPASIRNGADC